MNEIDFINKWSPNGFENPYQNYCFKADLEKIREQTRAEERERIIENINRELSNSNNSQYRCENGEIIKTDVGYVQEWFEEYKKQLKENNNV